MSDILNKNIIDRLRGNVFPSIGQASIKQITVPKFLKLLRRIEERGARRTQFNPILRNIPDSTFLNSIAANTHHAPATRGSLL